MEIEVPPERSFDDKMFALRERVQDLNFAVRALATDDAATNIRIELVPRDIHLIGRNFPYSIIEATIAEVKLL